jgi:hypothetical protein
LPWLTIYICIKGRIHKVTCSCLSTIHYININFIKPMIGTKMSMGNKKKRVARNANDMVTYSRKANSLIASLVKPRVTWFSFENVDMFVGHENCRTKTSFIYTVENIETSYIVFFSAIITSTICLLDLTDNFSESE